MEVRGEELEMIVGQGFGIAAFYQLRQPHLHVDRRHLAIDVQDAFRFRGLPAEKRAARRDRIPDATEREVAVGRRDVSINATDAAVLPGS